jgi:hypothetical protein
MYKTELDAMVTKDPSKMVNFKPYIIEAKDITLTVVLHPIWAKTVYDAFQQCLMNFPTDMITAIYSLTDPDNLNVA